DFDVSRDGERILFKQQDRSQGVPQDRWTVAPLADSVKAGEGVLNTRDIQVATDPRAEWREMYREAFRLQRAFFYDPGYHGLDLAATERFYARWLDGLASRATA